MVPCLSGNCRGIDPSQHLQKSVIFERLYAFRRCMALASVLGEGPSTSTSILEFPEACY